MKKMTFILGAGASVEYGAPVMTQFWDRVDYLIHSDELSKPEKQTLLDAQEIRAVLGRVQSRVRLDMDNIEEVFGLVEMDSLVGSSYLSAALKRSDLGSPLKIFTSALCIVYSRHLALPEPGTSYRELLAAALGGRARREMPASGHDVRFVTFNYDVLLEHALLDTRDDKQIEYGISDSSVPPTPPNPDVAVPILKLHGSTNWFINDEGNLPRIIMPESRGGSSDNWQRSAPHLPYPNTPLSDLGGPYRPLIIPPTWAKGRKNSVAHDVWERALKVVKESDYIFVIGYSLPESDLFFKYFLALTYSEEFHTKHVVVINPDKSGVTEKRFRQFFGDSISRNRLSYWPLTFRDSLYPQSTLGPLLKVLQKKLEPHTAWQKMLDEGRSWKVREPRSLPSFLESLLP